MHPAFPATRFLQRALPLLATAGLASAAMAQSETADPEVVATTAEMVQINLNVVWTLAAAILVFFMQAGFALVELGFTRAKNSINIIMKNFMDFCVASVGFFVIGYAVMFGDSIGGILGANGFMLLGEPADSEKWAFLIFQTVFAGTAATIVAGAMAERTKFVGYIIFSALISIVVYPVFGHWAWNENGWLGGLGFHDFAGSGVVHMVGGAAALAGIIVVGARQGRFGRDGRPRLIVGHNMPLAALGVFILWFAWFGFNAGSTTEGIKEIGRIAVNTNLAAAVGAITAMVSIWRVHGRPDIGVTLNGALGGLVGITAGCDTVTAPSAMAVGAIAGILTTWSSVLMEKRQLDDAVGAVPVHFVNGIWGLVAVAIFNENGFSLGSLGVQVLGAVVGAGFAFGTCYAIFRVINATIGLRATKLEQEEGLDFHEHAASAYPDFNTSEQRL
jgi:Amt family ammonium transporter